MSSAKASVKFAHNIPTGMKIVATVNVRTYDVWGNAEDGYQVNDSYNQGDQEVVLKLSISNVPLSPEGDSLSYSGSVCFSYALTDNQIANLLGLWYEKLDGKRRRTNIEVDGDDRTYYVNRASDGYPIGEIHIESWRAFDPEKDSV